MAFHVEKEEINNFNVEEVDIFAKLKNLWCFFIKN